MEFTASQPLVSVYIPTHNRCQLLKRAIASVMAQNHQNFELLVVNDGSSDETRDYLNALASTDNRIKVFHSYPAGGACKARNIAIDNAEGEFITGLDDDDEFLPDRICSLLSAMDNHCSFVTSALYWDYGPSRRIVDAVDQEITLEDVLSHKYATPQMLTRTDYLREAGKFDEAFPTCQDWDAWTRLIITKGSAKKISHASYVIHTAHDSPRISLSSKKVLGVKMFIDKYQHLMTPKNKKDMKVIQIMKEGGRLSLSQFFGNMTERNFGDYLKYRLNYLFPSLSSLYSRLMSR